MSKKKVETMKMYKVVRPNGTDFRTGTVNYATALESGECLEIDAAPATGSVCGHGLHVSPTARKTIQFANREHRPWRYFEVEVYPSDVVESDSEKSRVRRLKVIKELSLTDIFGEDFAKRIEAVRTELVTWKDIPWLKPSAPVLEKQLLKLFHQWLTAIHPWLKGKNLPKKMRVVRTAAAAAFKWRYWMRWYTRPYYVLRRFARWKLAGMEQENLWEPLVEMYRLGAIPIGYSKGKFVIYLPQKEE